MKIVYIVISLIFVIFLTLTFWLSPDYVLEKLNESQNVIYIKANESSGNFLTAYHYKDLQLEKDGKLVLNLEQVKIDLSLLKLFLGNVSIDISSDKINGYLSLTFNKKIQSELNFKNISFDTDLLKIPSSISFSAFMDGRLKINRDLVSLEFNLNEINWRSFEIEGNKLPYDIFTKARGGIEIIGDKVNIKSFGFEGDRGYARLIGDIIQGKSNLFIEIFPKDFSDPYMLPFFEYKQSAGYYKIPVSLKE